jgi:hypothetical protein
MTNAEIIALASVGVSIFALLITVIGWHYNHEAQKDLAKRQATDNAALQTKLENTRQEFAIELQKMQHIGKARFADLQIVNDWWKEGFDLANQFASIDEKLDKNRRLYGLYRRWRNNFHRRMGTAAQIDQIRFGGEHVYDSDDLDPWFKDNKPPRKLTSLVSAMSELVGDFAMDAENPSTFEANLLHDKLEILFTGGSAIIQKIEAELFQTTTDQAARGAESGKK